MCSSRPRCARLVGRVVREEGRRLCGERPSPVSTPFPCSEPSGPALWSESARSQAFLVGVSLESRPFGSESAWSQRFPGGAGYSGRSWRGVSAFSLATGVSCSSWQLESAWSQVFWVGVSVESALSHWSQPLQLESARSQQLRSLRLAPARSTAERAELRWSGGWGFGYVGPNKDRAGLERSDFAVRRVPLIFAWK